MTEHPVCLTLIVPHRLREEVFDYLTEQSDWFQDSRHRTEPVTALRSACIRPPNA